ncbi:hypothetical protein A5893_16440 [Pedobacter psychrophilus]|uniref:Secretion system C-terminal sorting domain-containing protein n=1 Tax=Pedobacter psychrophilus TaxID=1826909 RepID=A0A179DAD6_9SPHI|nr:T9SS type A sorting domain-containing protein [Pedobacter psychrophilus]OAQ37958.1 hypothetical protein A5893_16440 [Pedobacter psychrophilus]
MKYYIGLILIILSPFFTKGQIKIANNTNLVISNGANLVIDNLSLINGTTAISGDGKLILSGLSPDNTIMTNGSIKNLSINKSGGVSVKLLSSVDLNGTIELVSGKLDLNGYNLDLGTNGQLLGETETSFITGSSGFIIRQATLNAPSSTNPGNLGLSITSSSNLGLTTIKRGNYSLSDGTNFTLKRFFDITPTNNSNINATVRFNYLDAEIGSLDENQLKLISSANGGITWNNINFQTLNTTNNYVEASGLSNLNLLSLANNFTTLPITSLQLSAKQNINSIILKWATLGENNVSHFILQKSTDGKTFIDINKTTSLSSIRRDNNYEFEDRNPFKGLNYYQIKSIDYDGGNYTSSPIAINYDLSIDNSVVIYPNPTTHHLSCSFYLVDKQLTTFQIISSIGKIEISKSFSAEAGLNNFSLDVSQIPSGTYFLKASNNSLNKTFKFIKN